jgi:hypothetical protein
MARKNKKMGRIKMKYLILFKISTLAYFLKICTKQRMKGIISFNILLLAPRSAKRTITITVIDAIFHLNGNIGKNKIMNANGEKNLPTASASRK